MVKFDTASITDKNTPRTMIPYDCSNIAYLVREQNEECSSPVFHACLLNMAEPSGPDHGLFIQDLEAPGARRDPNAARVNQQF